MSLIGRLHAGLVFDRRVRVLVGHLAALIPKDACVLDVGCGDGTIAARLMTARPDIQIQGIDVLRRPQTAIPVRKYDGVTIPYADNTIDVVLFVDVLHHTDDPRALIAEAFRVATRAVVVKDHTRDGPLARQRLRLMDWVGNAHHGVHLPYNYRCSAEWSEMIEAVGARVEAWNNKLCLYPFPASLLFDSSLHFVAKLVQRRGGTETVGEFAQ